MFNAKNNEVLKYAFVIAAAFGISTAFAAPKAGNKVIYGNDDRLDLFEVSDAGLVDAARSTVGLFKSVNVSTDATRGVSTLATRKYGETMNLCRTEKFFDQSTGAFCSGSLVAPNLIMTAGHCISPSATAAMNCSNVKFVFDFAIRDANGVTPSEVPAGNVYSCKKIVAHRLDGGRGVDYALVEIDRAVTDRAPVKIARQSNLAVGAPLTVIGHPVGLPTKIAGGASVRSLANGYFIANLDTYGGNSGSAVFNTNTGAVEGILVRGETDFVSQNGCRASYVCTNTGCRGEDSTSVSHLVNLIPRQ